MTHRFTPAAIVAAAALSTSLVACGGSGSTGSTTPAAPTNAQPQSQGSIPMTFSFRRNASSSTARRPRYLSNDTESLALFDGSTLVYVANLALDSGDQFSTFYAATGNTTVTPGSCTFTESEATCTVSVTTTTGAHKFDVTTYPVIQGATPSSVGRRPVSAGARSISATSGGPPTLEGVILSEGELSVTLVAGTNPAKTLTLNGVADQAIFAGAGEFPYNTPEVFGYQIEDSGGAQIVTPGTYDNGPVTITAAPPGLVTIVPSSISTPPSSMGDQNFTVTCVNTAGGDVTITIGAGTHPNTTYASGLTYSPSNYSSGTLASFGITCDAATATIPITVDSTSRR